MTTPGWAQLPVYVLQLELEMRADFRLPAFAGSLFRGVLGWALRDVCSASEYGYLFESNSDQPGQRDAARPFVLLPPLEGRALAQGERFVLELHLFGQATDHADKFLEAIVQAGRYGLGRERASFELVKVLVREGRRSWVHASRGANWKRSFLPLPTALSAFVPELPEQEVSEIQVEFVTPTRLIFRGQRVLHPGFHIVLRSLLRRLDSMLTHHGGQPLSFDFPVELSLAEKVETVHSSTRWVDWERVSSRQGRHLMGGIVGKTTYRGDFPRRWLELLALIPAIHLGKATTFGMGRSQMQITSLKSALPAPPVLTRKETYALPVP